MFPSKSPLLYVIHTLGIFLMIGLCLLFGFEMKQPLALLSILALSYLPEWPLVQNHSEGEDDDDPGYRGSHKFGFGSGGEQER